MDQEKKDASNEERIKILRLKYGEGDDMHPEVAAYDKAHGKKVPKTGDVEESGERPPHEFETGHQTREHPKGAINVPDNGPAGPGSNPSKI